MYPDEDPTQRQILQALLTIQKRLGCIGAMLVLVICPAALYLIFALGSCHYANHQINEEIKKWDLPGMEK